jgi:hypothetical protein
LEGCALSTHGNLCHLYWCHHLQFLQTDAELCVVIFLATILEFPKIAWKMLP